MNPLFLALAMYALAILISLLVAVLIKGIVVSLSMSRNAKIRPAEPILEALPAQTEEDIAVISAALFASLGPQRIIHIESGDRGRLWTAAARASHHSSHNIQHRAKH
jgi:hypothetical protein